MIYASFGSHISFTISTFSTNIVQNIYNPACKKIFRFQLLESRESDLRERLFVFMVKYGI